MTESATPPAAAQRAAQGAPAAGGASSSSPAAAAPGGAAGARTAAPRTSAEAREKLERLFVDAIADLVFAELNAELEAIENGDAESGDKDGDLTESA